MTGARRGDSGESAGPVSLVAMYDRECSCTSGLLSSLGVPRLASGLLCLLNVYWSSSSLQAGQQTQLSGTPVELGWDGLRPQGWLRAASLEL